jgi:hypothetical protein
MIASKHAAAALLVLAVGLGSLAAFSWSSDDPPKPAARPPVGVQLGPNASLGGRRVFPADNPWNVEIAHIPADPNSDAYVASIGAEANLHPDFGTTYNGQPWGIPYVVVPGDQPRFPVNFEYAEECDQCLYPIPPDAPIEGGPDSDGDRHMIIVDRNNWKLYELYAARLEDGNWKAGSGSVFDLNSNALRPAGWTSADAAGLPIFAGLVRYDEVMEQKEIRHALRFTARRTRRAYVYPARHWASKFDEENLPPMGLRVRLKADVDISSFPPSAQVILKALKKYGMMLADNGGNWYLSGAPDPRWNDKDVSTLKQIKGKDLEVVRIGNIVTP